MTFGLKTSAAEFAAAVSACTPFIDRSGAIPILKTIRIEVADGVATLMATNLDMTLTVRIAAEGQGATCIDAASLALKTKLLDDGEFSAGENGSHITVTHGRTRWSLPFLPYSDFPRPAPVQGATIEAGEDFIAALKVCRPVVETSETRYYIAGVRVDGDRLIATNGWLLHAVQIGAQFPAMTIPTRAVDRITALFPKGCRITASELAAEFAREDITLRAKLVEGSYPDWRRIVDGFIADAHGSALADRDELAAAVNRAVAMAADDRSYVKTKLTIGADQISISASNGAGEESSDYCRCERISGDDKEVSLSGQWFAASVSSLDCDTVAVCFGPDPSIPILIRPKAGEREDIRIVMPRAF